MKIGKGPKSYIGHRLCMAQRSIFLLVCANVGWEKVSRNTCVVRVMVFRGVRRPFPSFSFTMSEALARAQLWRKTGEGNPLELRFVLKVWMQKCDFTSISRAFPSISRAFLTVTVILWDCTGPEIITCYGLHESGWKKLRSPAFCGWKNRKLITQFHATHGK